jgi:hypothetical protein
MKTEKKQEAPPEQIYIIPDLHKDGAFYREWIADGAPQRQGVGYVRLTVLQQILHRFAPDESGTCVCGMLKLWQFHIDEESDQQPPPQITDKQVAEIVEAADAAVIRVGASRNCHDAPEEAERCAKYVADAVREKAESLLRQPAVSERASVIAECVAVVRDLPPLPAATGPVSFRDRIVAALESLLQQPATSELRICTFCFHNDVDREGTCKAEIRLGPFSNKFRFCGCKCVFPAQAQSYREGFDDAARVTRTLNQVAITGAGEEAAASEIYKSHASQPGDGLSIQRDVTRSIAAIISKHCTADAGEVERLRGILRSQRKTIKHWQRHVLITSRLLGCSATDRDVEGAIDKLKGDYTLARSDAARAAMSIANTCLQEHNHTSRGEAEATSPAACIYFALQSLTKKEGDNAPTN